MSDLLSRPYTLTLYCFIGLLLVKMLHEDVFALYPLLLFLALVQIIIFFLIDGDVLFMLCLRRKSLAFALCHAVSAS